MVDAPKLLLHATEDDFCSSASFEAGDETVVELEPRPLRNLLQVDDIDSLCPVMDCKALEQSGGASAARASRGPRGCAPSSTPTTLATQRTPKR